MFLIVLSHNNNERTQHFSQIELILITFILIVLISGNAWADFANCTAVAERGGPNKLVLGDITDTIPPSEGSEGPLSIDFIAEIKSKFSIYKNKEKDNRDKRHEIYKMEFYTCEGATTDDDDADLKRLDRSLVILAISGSLSDKDDEYKSSLQYIIVPSIYAKTNELEAGLISESIENALLSDSTNSTEKIAKQEFNEIIAYIEIGVAVWQVRKKNLDKAWIPYHRASQKLKELIENEESRNKIRFCDLLFDLHKEMKRIDLELLRSTGSNSIDSATRDKHLKEIVTTSTDRCVE